MKNFKLKSMLFIIVMGFIVLQSCEKKAITEEQNSNIYTENDFEFSKTFTTGNKSLVNAKFELFTDNKELLNMGNKIIIEPVFEKMKIENNNILTEETDETDNTKPDFYLNIININLPEGSTGYKVILPDNNTKSYWNFDFEWPQSWGVEKLRVKKTNSKGKVKVRIGILYNSSQGWYTNKVNSTLKGNGSTTSYNTPSSYYKVRLRVKLKSGGTAEYTVWYDDDTVYTGDI